MTTDRTTDNSALGQYLRRVANGDLACLERLCQQIADRLVFVPVVESASAGGWVTVGVYRHQGELGSECYLFTSERRFDEWVAQSGSDLTSISLLGADLCAALPEGSALIIDSGASHSIGLPFEYVQMIASVPASDTESEFDAVLSPISEVREALLEIPKAVEELERSYEGEHRVSSDESDTYMDIEPLDTAPKASAKEDLQPISKKNEPVFYDSKTESALKSRGAEGEFTIIELTEVYQEPLIEDLQGSLSETKDIVGAISSLVADERGWLSKPVTDVEQRAVIDNPQIVSNLNLGDVDEHDGRIDDKAIAFTRSSKTF